MIRGSVVVDEAVIVIRLQGPAGNLEVDAVLDTGFTEFLTLPNQFIDALQLPHIASMPVVLAGNVNTSLDTYRGWIEWDGTDRMITVLHAEGGPLVGMKMLKGYRTCIDGVNGGPVTISSLQP